MPAPVFDSTSLPFVEEMFAKFQQDPNAVGPEWKAYFSGWLAASDGAGGTADAKSLGRYMFIQAWRNGGHKAAWLNPLAAAPHVPASLQPEAFGLKESDLDATCLAIRQTYGGTTGVEIEVVSDPAHRTWTQEWWENPANRQPPSAATRKKLYEGLVKANALERFLHTKFVGAKRFSIEGNDGLLPLCTWLSETLLSTGKATFTMGMAHRGRLNLLCNLFHKPLAELFAAFADKLELEGGPSAGDVKYHMGKVYTLRGATGGEVEMSLLFNPSHLEAVNPAVMGQSRAKADTQARQTGKSLDSVLPSTLSVLVHGDSAVVGQGTVTEAFNLALLPTFTAGGTIHFVTNNQVGFTADPWDATGYHYCTDAFKATGSPIVHVNADDIEACLVATRFAWEYRQAFQADVMLDLVGYRRWGHNEGDDPTFTQAAMYEVIRAHPVPADVYKAKLLAEGALTEAEAKAVEDAYQAELNTAYAEAMKGLKAKGHVSAALKPDAAQPATATTVQTLESMAKAWEATPNNITLNSKVAKVLEERASMLRGQKPLNWGAAETAAYGALVAEGTSVRLTGQDVQRGTFSHRHAVVVGECGAEWNPLQALATKGATNDIAISALSEFGVMMYEYGYSLGAPETLTIWEAQFGDFANGAQVVTDQFLSAAAAKWGQANGLTVLLPHGMEGQGPEHSSARLERFLQLAAEDNMSICVPSTPAQIFHLLRRQAMRKQKKPLVVMTPKSLLRNPLAVSDRTHLTEGTFQPVLADEAMAGKTAKKVVLCSGKVYYDLLARRNEMAASGAKPDVALLRLEELYPFPEKAIESALKACKAKDVYWVQEEPRNMGAWWYLRENWQNAWGYLHYVGRPAAASPAVGTTARHNVEQTEILNDIFGKPSTPKAA